jgi:hypothetical protein
MPISSCIMSNYPSSVSIFVLVVAKSCNFSGPLSMLRMVHLSLHNAALCILGYLISKSRAVVQTLNCLVFEGLMRGPCIEQSMNGPCIEQSMNGTCIEQSMNGPCIEQSMNGPCIEQSYLSSTHFATSILFNLNVFWNCYFVGLPNVRTLYALCTLLCSVLA